MECLIFNSFLKIYFGIAPQTQILIYIFFNVALCNCNQKPMSLCISLFIFKR